jgi:hypothetical protein
MKTMSDASCEIGHEVCWIFKSLRGSQAGSCSGSPSWAGTDQGLNNSLRQASPDELDHAERPPPDRKP